LVEILPIVNVFFFRLPFFLGAAHLPPLCREDRSEIFVTKNPFWRINCCASS
jgi:hypothetical protein